MPPSGPPPPLSSSMGQPSNIFTPQGQAPSTQPHFHSDSQNVNLQPHLAGHHGQLPTSSSVFQPVRSHWFYSKHVEGKELWKPFSYKDAARLEDALHRRATASGSEIIVPTQGGRYDVDVIKRQQFAVYWDEEPSSVTRSSWFYKPEGAARFLPYDEQFCARLEEEYQAAVMNNVWPRKLQIDEGTIVMHSPYTIEHYSTNSIPDEYGTIPLHSRARCVIRGTQDFEDIEEGEPDQIDHLVFVVHGIGPVCDLRFRDIRECLDDFRSVSLSLMQSHFKQYLERGQAGRVEYLPVHWHKALHGEATGVDRKLREITLKSIPKLRHFTNDTLLDLLFYTSPVYCQQIADTVSGEMNRLHELFLQRQPNFKGNVSVMGHSLGSQILFDLLLHQKDSEGKALPAVSQEQGQLTFEREVSPLSEESHVEDADEEEEESLEALLEKLGLSSFLETFNKEQIDLDSLTEIEESDIKEMGLPMGPRKKLQKYIRNKKEKEKKKQETAASKSKREAAQKIIEEQKQAASEATCKLNSNGQGITQEHPLLKQASSTSISYVTGLAGTGQPCVSYPQLQFEMANFFALGSPIAMFMTVRGVGSIGEEYKLPTCPGFFNIFHPFDPVAYRIEPLINPNYTMKPVLMPHHKGRKRLHLELKESLSRYGADLKQKIVQSLKGTWNMINDFARAHRSTPEEIVNSEVDSVISDLAKQQEETEQASVASEEEIIVGSMNQGRRIDYVLQEKPIESFNDYLFALGSHACYWESEDTALMILKEIYLPLGMTPVMPGSDLTANRFPRPPSQQSLGPSPTMLGAPPRGPPMGPPSGPPPGHPSGAMSGPAGYSAGPLPGNYAAVSRGSPPPPYTAQQAPAAAPPSGPPPLQGFVRR
ncbi:phospholipase DDHD2 [Lingula anatina]|uniref:Phospholipase DDHD2 n=1 Tax=Lingula anatina TaxID=7574 RepID=A0A1S3JAW2_LINAN|nr:phospholipase DDHD2 [Lingula anatina]|eukprot:XP_013407537.1 phospholipase DDHD2 [Lingula anatina]